jgi:hypothetical protein
VSLINRFFFLFIFTLFSTVLHASDYDDDTLDIFSKIIPRFVLMSSQKNTLQNKISICILHDKFDARAAETLTDKIYKNYPDGIKNYKIKVTESDYSNVDVCGKSQLVFMFDSNENNIDNSIRILNQYPILTMSYNANYLENGVDATLFLGRKVVPYINMRAMRQSGIDLDNILVQISKIYARGDSK